jgi:HSP20 family protein
MTPDYFDDLDDLFERVRRGPWSDHFARVGAEADVAVDVTRDDEAIVVTADVPGFESADLDVTVDDDVLTIRATAGVESTVDEAAYLRRERRHHERRRTIHLPASVDADGASATYRNGVLTVRLPVAGDDDARHVAVE